MNRLTGDIEHQGWRIGLGFAGGAAGGASFYAVYTGDVFGRPERGVLAAMARAHPVADGAAGEAGQIVVHEFAEGYFSAPPTLGPKRAVGRALAGINDWMVAQLRHAGDGRLAPVSLSALLFHGSRLAVVGVGCCRLFRVRRDRVAPLLHEQAPELGAPSGLGHPAVGRDAELPSEFVEEAAEDGDRYVLLSGLGAAHAQAVQALLAQGGEAEEMALRLCALLAQDTALGGAAAAMVLDVMARPPAEGAGEALAGLPLRPAPQNGELWDGYKIGKTLHRGRYTEVRAAYDELDQREVALKIPLPAMLQDEVFAAGFMREARIGTAVRSGNVARYLEVPEERRRSLYLVMPLYKGETLEARLQRAPPVSLPDGVGTALKLCEAVQDLAAIQVVHRDIKPDNVMLLDRNEVRLLDLGLAYLPGLDAQDAVKPGGTLRYMAPELIKGGPASAASEVYALAVTVYRMFAAGAYPFGQREKRPLARLRPDLPRWLGEVLAEALAPEPGRRFADAGVFGAALQAGLIGGEDEPAAVARRFEAARLRLWQGAALLFAGAFLLMLMRALR